jgi:hypothetical protein
MIPRTDTIWKEQSSSLKENTVSPWRNRGYLPPRSTIHLALAFSLASVNSANKTLSASTSIGEKLPTQPRNHVPFLKLITIAAALPIAVPTESSRFVDKGTNLPNLVAEVREFLCEAVDQAIDFELVHPGMFVLGVRGSQSFTCNQAVDFVVKDTSKVDFVAVVVGHEAELAVAQDLEVHEHDDGAHLDKRIVFQVRAFAVPEQGTVPSD